MAIQMVGCDLSGLFLHIGLVHLIPRSSAEPKTNSENVTD